MSPGELRAELAELEHQRELMDRAHLAAVPQSARDAAAWALSQHELASLGTLADAERPALPGLVSIPTSGTPTRRKAPIPFALRAAAAVAVGTTGAFLPDPAASKLARLRGCIGLSARAHESVRVDEAATVMVTLTYAAGNAGWNPRHVSAFLATVREWLRRRGHALRYVWVAELQRRGAIHYHVALWLPAGVQLPKPDEAGWWPHGMTRIERARAAVAYLMKYLTKGNDAATGTLPSGARSHGRGGLSKDWRACVRWLSLPAFIKARADGPSSREWRRAPGGGWVDPDGQLWASEFARTVVGLGYGLIRVRDHGRPAPVDGVFCAWPRVAAGGCA